MSKAFYGRSENLQNTEHTSKPGRAFPYGLDGRPKSQYSTPPQCTYTAKFRNKPQGATPNGALANLSQTDYLLQGIGFTRELMLELQIRNDSVSAINVLPRQMIQRIEFYSTENNDPFQTVYNDEIYGHIINYDYEYLNRVALAEGINPTTFGGVSIAAGVTNFYYLHIPCFIDYCPGINLGALKSQLRFRIYWSSFGSDTPANCIVLGADVLALGIDFTPSVESYEKSQRIKDLIKYRFSSAIPVATQSYSNMTANSQYDIQLTSANGYFSHLLVFVRPGNDSYANRINYAPLLSLQLFDANMQPCGIEEFNTYLRTKTSLQFSGWVLNTTSGLPGYYVLPFFEGPANSTVNAGNATGGFVFSGIENLRIKTPGTFSPGAYTVYIYGFQYNTLIVNQGNLSRSLSM